jgi:hypothetical protein
MARTLSRSRKVIKAKVGAGAMEVNRKAALAAEAWVASRVVEAEGPGKARRAVEAEGPWKRRAAEAAEAPGRARKVAVAAAPGKVRGVSIEADGAVV